MADSPVGIPSSSTSTSVPHPAGTEPPVKENASTVLPMACIRRPFAAASPPLALFTVAPSTSN